MPRKKSKFLTFCFSFVPGFGEMYLGFFKMGISLIGIFTFFLLVSSVLNLGVLFVFSVIPWAYSFFHSNHINSLPDEEFYSMEDYFLFPMQEIQKEEWERFLKKYRNLISIVMIYIGISVLWENFYRMIRSFPPQFVNNILSMLTYRLPQVIFALILIGIGAWMIQGKRQELNRIEEKEEEKQKFHL